MQEGYRVPLNLNFLEKDIRRNVSILQIKPQSAVTGQLRFTWGCNILTNNRWLGNQVNSHIIRSSESKWTLSHPLGPVSQWTLSQHASYPLILSADLSQQHLGLLWWSLTSVGRCWGPVLLLPWWVVVGSVDINPTSTSREYVSVFQLIVSVWLF